MSEPELIVLWDGSHRGSDCDLFSPVEWAPEETRLVPKRAPQPYASHVAGERTVATIREAVTRDWALLSTIAERASVSVFTARRVIRDLMAAGEVEWQARPTTWGGSAQKVYRRKP